MGKVAGSSQINLFVPSSPSVYSVDILLQYVRVRVLYPIIGQRTDQTSLKKSVRFSGYHLQC